MSSVPSRPGRSSHLVVHPLPKHSWPARQKEKLDKPGAIDRFLPLSSTLCQQIRASVAQKDRTKSFHDLSDALQAVCSLSEFDQHLTIFHDLKVGDSPGGSRPRHRAVAVGYNPASLSRGYGSLFPLDSPIPAIEDLRFHRHQAIQQSSFLLVGDAASRAFRSANVPDILQNSLRAMGTENFDMINPMKAFQSSSFNHVGCPLGLLSHLSFLYQCEIKDDARVTISTVWVKIVEADDDTSSNGDDDAGASFKYCKAPIESFDVTDPTQAAKLMAWLYAVNQWALKERMEALRLAQQLDEVRQQRFQYASVALLQEFGADLSTAWLSEHVLKAIPNPSSLERFSTKSISSPASTMRKGLAKRAKKDRAVIPPQPEPPHPMMSWKGLLPPHKLEGFPKEEGSARPGRSESLPHKANSSRTGRSEGSPKKERTRRQTRSAEPPERTQMPSTDTTSSSGRNISGDKFIASLKGKRQTLADRLVLMSAIYDSIAPAEVQGHLKSNILLPAIPTA